jgi:hypothetical protein
LQEAAVFPNPVGEGYVFLAGEALEVADSYELLDVTGKLVRKGQLDGSGRIDMRMVTRGSYLIRLFERGVLWGRGKVIKR